MFLMFSTHPPCRHNLGGFFGNFFGKIGLVIDFDKSRWCFVVMVMVYNVMLIMVAPWEYIRYFSVNKKHVLVRGFGGRN